VAEKALRLRPDTVFGADLIAGFPTETDAHFQDSLRIVAEAHLTYLHVFPYSPRPGTPAAKMPQLSGPVIKARAAELRAVGDAALSRYLDSQAGRVEEILLEDVTLGRTRHFVPVIGVTGTPGARVQARLLAREGEQMRGEAA
jgi:threonylcarbamoyladenosine tRNA methylthiotransferase MtaB